MFLEALCTLRLLDVEDDRAVDGIGALILRSARRGEKDPPGSARRPVRASAFSFWRRSLFATRSSSVNPLDFFPVAVVLLGDFCVPFFAGFIMLPFPIDFGSPNRARTWDLRINGPSILNVISLHHQLIKCLRCPRTFAIAVECSATQGHAK